MYSHFRKIDVHLLDKRSISPLSYLSRCWNPSEIESVFHTFISQVCHLLMLYTVPAPLATCPRVCGCAWYIEEWPRQGRLSCLGTGHTEGMQRWLLQDAEEEVTWGHPCGVVTGERRKEGLKSEKLRPKAEDGREGGRGLGGSQEGQKVEEGGEGRWLRSQRQGKGFFQSLREAACGHQSRELQAPKLQKCKETRLDYFKPLNPWQSVTTAVGNSLTC